MNLKIVRPIADALTKLVRALPTCDGIRLAIYDRRYIRLELSAPTDQGARKLAALCGIALEDRLAPRGRYLSGEAEDGLLRVCVVGPFSPSKPYDEARLTTALETVAHVTTTLPGDLPKP